MPLQPQAGFAEPNRAPATSDGPVADVLSLWPVLLFWPAVGVSVLVAGLGLLRRRASSLIAAAILVGPASLYLAATPRFRYVGLLPIVAYLLAASATRRGHVRLGWMLVAATTSFFGWLALLVWSE